MGLTRIRAEQISDIDYKQAVRVITLTNITLAGGAPNAVDGVNLLANDRILVAGQSTGSQNGLYRVQTLGAGSNGTWVRTSDGNEDGEIEAGMIVMVTEGTTYKDTQWKLITNNPIVIGTTALVFEQNSAFAFGNIFANGTAVLANIVGDTVTFTAGNNIAITGNATAKSVTIGVTGISLNSISNGTSNVNVVSSGGNVTVGINGTNNTAVFGQSSTTFAGNVLPSANITYDLGSTSQRWRDIWLSNSTIYLGNAQISANATSLIFTNPQGAQTVFSGTTANVSAGTVTATGNITGGNLITSGIISATGNANVGNIGATNANLSGATVSGNANVGNLGTAGQITATGNVTGGNLNTGGRIVATGNITGGNLAGTLVTGTLTTAAQPNVTSLGTLSSLTVVGPTSHTGNIDVTGNINVTGNLNYSNVTDLIVGDPLIFLGANNSGNVVDLGEVVQWNPGTGTQYGGLVRDASDGTWKLFGNVTAAPTTTVDFTNALYQSILVGPLTASSGSFSTTLSVTGNANVGNLGTAGLIVATGNITGGNLNTGARVVATGNITGGNLTTAGRVDATGNITGGNLAGTSITGTLLTAAQTNITSVGTLTSLAVTGNTTSGNFIGTLNGSGANVTSISATNISSGTLAQARLANANVVLGSTTLTLGTTTTTITGLSSVTSTTFVGALTGAATTAGTVTTAAQPNITSVGTLTSLTVTGNVAGGNLNTAGQVVATGNVTGGNLKTSSVTIGSTGAISGVTTLSASGNANVGNIGAAAGVFTGAITGSSTITATGNITGGNIVTAGRVTATGNVGGNFFTGNGSALTGINAFGTISVSGQDNVVADSTSDTLTLVAGDGIVLTTAAGTDTITIATSGSGDSIFISGGDMGTVTEAVTSEEDLGLIADVTAIEIDMGTIVTGGVIYPDQLVLPSFTVSQLANLSTVPAAQMVFCTNESGGAVPVFSDGTNWRRVTDRAIVT